MLQQLRSYLLDTWPALGLGGPPPRDLFFLVQGTGVGKLCCFIFAGGESLPRGVAKLTRSPADNQRLLYEYGLIQHLRSCGRLLRATVPGPLALTSLAGHACAIERFLPGRPLEGLLVESDGRAVRRYLDLGAGWLLRAQRESGQPGRRLSDEELRRHLLAPIGRLRGAALLTLEELAYLDELEGRLAALARLPLPLVFNHGDFRPANLLLADGELQVIDWEFGAPLAPPLLDIFSLLARVYDSRRGVEEIDGYLEEYLEGFEQVFFAEGAFAHHTRAIVERACTALEIDRAWVATLLALFLVIEAERYHSFLTRRARQGYVYLLRSRGGRVGGSYTEQLGRQKYVWLLGHLARNEGRLFNRGQGCEQWQTAIEAAPGAALWAGSAC